MDANATDNINLDIRENKLGNLLRISMSQNSISIRQLSQLTGISPATISRIMTGKQTASIQHIKEFSRCLNLSIGKLLHSVGVTNTEQAVSGSNLLLEIIQDVVKDLSIELDCVALDIQKELNKLEVYARTKDGEKTILESFPLKIAACDGAGAIIDQLNSFYKLFCEGTNNKKRAVAGSALLYFCLAIDVIPDYCFPIGYLDDAIAVKMVQKKLSQMND